MTVLKKKLHQRPLKITQRIKNDASATKRLFHKLKATPAALNGRFINQKLCRCCPNVISHNPSALMAILKTKIDTSAILILF